MFKPVDSKVNFPQMEERILQLTHPSVILRSVGDEESLISGRCFVPIYQDSA